MYSMAILEFIQNYNPEAITAKLNEMYKNNGSELDADIIQATHDLFVQEEW
ncbi:hypothetical protein MASR2M78_07160 [Treponema sp.]